MYKPSLPGLNLEWYIRHLSEAKGEVDRQLVGWRRGMVKPFVI